MFNSPLCETLRICKTVLANRFGLSVAHSWYSETTCHTASHGTHLEIHCLRLTAELLSTPSRQGWDGLGAHQQCCATGKALETLALAWTSAARAMEAVEGTSRSPGTAGAAGTGASAGGRTPKTALRTFPDCCPSSMSDTQHHSLLVIVLTHTSKWLIFILHFQLRSLSVNRIQNQERTDSQSLVLST